MDSWERFKWALDWASRIQLIFKVFLALGLGAVIRALSIPRVPSEWVLPIWLLSSAVFVALLERVDLSRFLHRKPETAKSFPEAHTLLVLSRGYPLRGLQSGIALHLQVQSSVATKIVYARATLSRVAGYHGRMEPLDLESYEPHLLPAGEFFPLILTKKGMQQDLVSHFLGPNTAINGIVKIEEDGKHSQFPFDLWTHQECPEDPNLPQLRGQLREAQAKIAELSKPPDDLHMELLCFLKASTFRLAMGETFYFLKLKLSCDEDTGIKSIKVQLTVGNNTLLVLQPINDLSGWRVQTQFESETYPYKSFDRQMIADISLWHDLQRNGLKSGLAKEGWLGIYVGGRKDDVVSKIEVQVTKSKEREPARFIFTTFPGCEGVHVNDFPKEI